jgi:hypothetical protein
MVSKNTPADLAVITYPGLQEVHSKMSELTRCLPQACHNATEPVPFRGRCSQRIYDDSFHSLANVVEALLDPNHKLSADARVTLRTALSKAPQFASIILPLFININTLHLLCGDKQLIDTAYAEYSRRLFLSRGSYPRFCELWRDIRDRKETWRTNAGHITRLELWKTAAIHRVWEDQASPDVMGKQVVLNSENPSEYPDSEFHKMYSPSSYVVGELGTGRSVQSPGPAKLHLFVDINRCPYKSDDELRVLLSERNGKGFIAEDWFICVHIVNLHRIKHIAKFMNSGAEVLLKCPKELRRVDRSPKVETPDVRIQQMSRMYEIGGGARCDQTGHMQAPHNFKRPAMDELSKFLLMQEDDHLIDGVLAVNPVFCSVKLTSDY